LVKFKKGVTETMSEINLIYKELATKIGFGESAYLPRILEKIANLEQAKIIRELPAPPEEIAERLNLDKETVDKHEQYLFERGLLLPGKKGYQLANSLGILHDTIGSADSKFDDDELFDLCAALGAERNESMINQVVTGELTHIRQIMRVIPKWESIKDIPGVLPMDDVREILRVADPIAIHHCPCRKIERNRECKDTLPAEVCIGRSAVYNLKRGIARELTYKEAMEMIDSFDEYPFVQLSGNRRATLAAPAGICICHNCCCASFVRYFLSMKRLNQSAIAKSRFIATIDPEKCLACRTCADERCPVGAAQMKDYPEFGEERASVDSEKCIGCGLCVISCPAEAWTMKLVRPPEHVPELGVDYSSAFGNE